MEKHGPVYFSSTAVQMLPQYPSAITSSCFPQKDLKAEEQEETEWCWHLGWCRAEMRSVEVPAGLDFVLTTLCAGA